MTSYKAPLIEGITGPWEVVIGLEVHAQVKSNAKLFSGASTDFGAEPNTQVSLVDAGFPGMLPVINTVCVDQAIRTGLGLHADINLYSVFDRKNYFYADLPTGYQISQFHHPIVGQGYLDVDLDENTTKRIGITRLHLEQDAGKSTHDLHPSRSYIDLNRAGVALMEIVSEPDIRSKDEAMAFVRKLRTLVRCLDTCDGNMEQGSLRADVNVSLRRPGEELGTRAEIKNINSIRFIGQAIDYEVSRQLGILEGGENVIQETRLFDPGQGITRSMRSKEEAHDYRYFPDPDLPPLRLDPKRVENIKAHLPELPDAKKMRFLESFGLRPYDASVLVSENDIARYFEDTLDCFAGEPDGDRIAMIRLATNWIIVELFGYLKKESLKINQSKVSPQHIAELVRLIHKGMISGKIAKDVLLDIWETGKGPEQIVDEKGLKQVSDPAEIEKIIDAVLAANPEKRDQYNKGKEKLFGFFVGQSMKATKGQGNPGLINEILKKKLPL